MKQLNYILVNGEPVPEPDPLKFAQWFSNADRHVALTYLEYHWISTIFLGIDHNWTSRGGPVLFETMVFTKETYPSELGGEFHEDVGVQLRYRTIEEARQGHELTVKQWATLEAQAARKARLLMSKTQKET